MKKFILFVIALLILPLASADITLHLGQNSAVGKEAGNMLQIPADLTNNEPCPLNCFYKYPDFPPGLDNKIGSNIQGRLDFMIQLKVPSNPQPYRIEIKAVCEGTEQCVGKRFEAVDYFEFLNAAQNQQNSCHCEDNGNCEQFECKSCKDCGGQGCVCNDNGNCEENECPECKDCAGGKTLSKDEPSAAEKIGNIIGIVFVILIALLIVFGFAWIIIKGIKKLKKQWSGEKEGKEDEGKRKLSAIMFTDMKGYSREMGQNEEQTLKKVWRYEKAMKSIIHDHEGRIVKTIGDAIMGDFNSAVNAVKAAIEIQSLLKKEDIKIRIGIHVGDVIHKGGDIFGDGVNIASRIESICEPGEIYISEDVYSQVKGKISMGFENLGNRPLKNIESPPKVYRISKK